jgi:hypothetical protein
VLPSGLGAFFPACGITLRVIHSDDDNFVLLD